MLNWLRKRLSPNWQRVHIVETPTGEHRLDTARSARTTEWVYAYAGTPTERRTEWEHVGGDEQ